MLPDAALYEEKARDANRKSYSKHAPAFPLEPHRLAYTVRERLKRTRSLPISAERDARVNRKRTGAGLPVSTSAQLFQKVDGKCQLVKWHKSATSSLGLRLTRLKGVVFGNFKSSGAANADTAAPGNT